MAKFSPKELSISDNGLNLIAQFEGFSEKVYKCPAGINTIGYGHVVLPSEKFTTITKQEGLELLKKDVRLAELGVKNYVKLHITQNMYDALVSFCFNLGNGALKNSTLLKKLNTGDYDGAGNEFKKWVNVNGKKSQGLVNRRNAEMKLFLS